MALSKRVPREQPFTIWRSLIAGRGGFATRRIREGARIAEYVGERITTAEADRRYDDEAMARADGHHTFLFVVDKRTVIDAVIGGNDSRFINHSCAPNCEAVIEDRRVFIEAIRTIQPGEELFYDYAYDREPGQGAAAEKLYPCRCGALNCRGTILAPRPKRRRPRGSARKRPSQRPSQRPAKGTAKRPARRSRA
jgi:SET domain-containing protein